LILSILGDIQGDGLISNIAIDIVYDCIAALYGSADVATGEAVALGNSATISIEVGSLACVDLCSEEMECEECDDECCCDGCDDCEDGDCEGDSTKACSVSVIEVEVENDGFAEAESGDGTAVGLVAGCPDDCNSEGIVTGVSSAVTGDAMAEGEVSQTVIESVSEAVVADGEDCNCEDCCDEISPEDVCCEEAPSNEGCENSLDALEEELFFDVPDEGEVSVNMTESLNLEEEGQDNVNTEDMFAEDHCSKNGEGSGGCAGGEEDIEEQEELIENGEMSMVGENDSSFSENKDSNKDEGDSEENSEENDDSPACGQKKP